MKKLDQNCINIPTIVKKLNEVIEVINTIQKREKIKDAVDNLMNSFKNTSEPFIDFRVEKCGCLYNQCKCHKQ
jgi:hypothetical protein